VNHYRPSFIRNAQACGLTLIPFALLTIIGATHPAGTEARAAYTNAAASIEAADRSIQRAAGAAAQADHITRLLNDVAYWKEKARSWESLAARQDVRPTHNELAQCQRERVRTEQIAERLRNRATEWETYAHDLQRYFKSYQQAAQQQARAWPAAQRLTTTCYDQLRGYFSCVVSR